MTTRKFAPLCIALLIFISCKKEEKIPVTKVVEFPSTNYLTLGSFDTVGKPSYLISPRDGMSSPLLTYINNTIKDKVDLRTTHPELFTTSAIADIVITKTSDVFITFVSQGGGFTSAFAFYTYPTGKPPVNALDIKTMTYVFANSGNKTPLQRGDKVKIGRFDSSTSIGFVVMQKAWDLTTRRLNNKVVHFLTDDVLNPEIDSSLRKHAVLVNYAPENKVIVAFEDFDRTAPDCDHDFNDVVFYCTVKQL